MSWYKGYWGRCGWRRGGRSSEGGLGLFRLWALSWLHALGAVPSHAQRAVRRTAHELLSQLALRDGDLAPALLGLLEPELVGALILVHRLDLECACSQRQTTALARIVHQPRRGRPRAVGSSASVGKKRARMPWTHLLVFVRQQEALVRKPRAGSCARSECLAAVPARE